MSDDIGKIMKQHGVKIVFKQGIRLRNILNNNNKRTILNRHNVVYDLSCKDCDEVYVGQTKRKLGTRIDEHKKAKHRNSLTSNVAEHALKNNHNVDFDNPRINYVENNHIARKWLESYQIEKYKYQNKNLMNDQVNSKTFVQDEYLLLLCNHENS